MLKEGQVRIPSGCAISGVFARDGRPISGEVIRRSIAVMHERSNGLGGGFAGYGIYPQYKNHYALHVFYDDMTAREECERFLDRHFDVINLSKIPTRPTPKIKDAPLIWRYFVQPLPHKLADSHLDEKEYVARCVIRINDQLKGSYVFSCGKNMGVFKAVGYPEDVADFYRLEEYEGYSCYDANRRAVEMYGYRCNLLTDTEVITYTLDYLLRHQGLTLEEAAQVVAAPFWSELAAMPQPEQKQRRFLRQMYSDLLITGPFSILVGFEGGMMALNDRLKLRSLVVAERGDRVYFASEEAAIREVEPELDRIWAPNGGEPVIVRLKEEEK